jgi:hypothetical protein
VCQGDHVSRKGEGGGACLTRPLLPGGVEAWLASKMIDKSASNPQDLGPRLDRQVGPHNI